MRITYPRMTRAPKIQDGYSYCVAAQEVLAARMKADHEAQAKTNGDPNPGQPPAPHWATGRQNHNRERANVRKGRQGKAAMDSGAGVGARPGGKGGKGKGKGKGGPSWYNSGSSWGGGSSDAGSKRDRAELEEGEVGSSGDEKRSVTSEMAARLGMVAVDPMYRPH